MRTDYLINKLINEVTLACLKLDSKNIKTRKNQ